jgi:protein gp37
MADRTGIEWTDATWNPLRGCTEVSPGCAHCYAAELATRFSGPGQPYEGLAYRDSNGRAHWTGVMRIVPEQLNRPLRWKRPRMIFVNSMSDLFHEDIPDLYIATVFAVMAEAHWHAFQVLTKRADRLALLASPRFFDAVVHAIWSGAQLRRPDFGDVVNHVDIAADLVQRWPLPNVWIGTSVENQPTAMSRIPALRASNAAVRFLSIEPLLGPLGPLPLRSGNGAAGSAIDWVIVGGESGPHARPIDPAWVRPIRDQCVRDSVPFFFKQWGGVHKKAAGRQLDGRTWDEMPAIAAEVVE